MEITGYHGNHRLPVFTTVLTYSMMIYMMMNEQKISGLYRWCLWRLLRSGYICIPSISHFCVRDGSRWSTVYKLGCQSV